MSSDDSDQTQTGRMQTMLSERAHVLMAEALQLLDEAQEAFAAAYLAQAIETLKPPAA